MDFLSRILKRWWRKRIGIGNGTDKCTKNRQTVCLNCEKPICSWKCFNCEKLICSWKCFNSIHADCGIKLIVKNDKQKRGNQQETNQLSGSYLCLPGKIIYLWTFNESIQGQPMVAEKAALQGLKQHYFKLKDHEADDKLLELLGVLKFNLVIVYVTSMQRCVTLTTFLTDRKFSAIGIHREMALEDRLSRYQQFKGFQKSVAVSIRGLPIGK